MCKCLDKNKQSQTHEKKKHFKFSLFSVCSLCYLPIVPSPRSSFFTAKTSPPITHDKSAKKEIPGLVVLEFFYLQDVFGVGGIRVCSCCGAPAVALRSPRAG